MKASKIFYNNEPRIKVDFKFNYESVAAIKKIPDSKWSKIHNAWHVPYDKQTFELLKEKFIELDYEGKATVTKSSANSESININQIISDVFIIVHGRNISVKLPRNEQDTRFILGFKYSRWDKKQYYWTVPNYGANLILLKNYFKDRNPNIEVYSDSEIFASYDVKRSVEPNQLLIIKTISGRLKLFFNFNNTLTRAARAIPYSKWNPRNKSWSIPYTERFLLEIQTIAKFQNLDITLEIEKGESEKAPRLTRSDISNYRTCPEEFILKLKELRYSAHTLAVYVNTFTEFINYYSDHDIESIT